MADIFQEVEEEVRKDKAAALWKKYGGYVIGACVALVIGTGAKVGWREYQSSRSIAESDRFVAAMRLAQKDKHSEAILNFQALADDAGSGYAVLARLREAASRTKVGDRAGAIAVYDAIVASGEGGATITDIARLLAVAQLMDGGATADITARLKPLLGGNNPLRFTAMEFQAMLSHRDGDIAGARKQFKALGDSAGVPPAVRQRAQQMITVLGKGS